MIDTQIHCDWDKGPEFAHNYPVTPTENQYNDQLVWLKNELDLTKNHDYVFVAGHYHIHSPSATTRCMGEIEDLRQDLGLEFDKAIKTEIKMNSAQNFKKNFHSLLRCF